MFQDLNDVCIGVRKLINNCITGIFDKNNILILYILCIIHVFCLFSRTVVRCGAQRAKIVTVQNKAMRNVFVLILTHQTAVQSEIWDGLIIDNYKIKHVTFLEQINGLNQMDQFSQLHPFDLANEYNSE